MQWDLFCRVIDNHGDVGVCWRLAAELAARGDAVRLWIDDASALAWLAPQERPGVAVVPWSDPAPDLEPGDVVVEAFGCDPPPAFVARMALRTPLAPAWINLEYLSAEGYVERNHRLPSPVSSGPGAGLVKTFFYPGFTPRTGGLLRESGLLERQAAFDRRTWLARWRVTDPSAQVVSLFCYEPSALPALLRQFAATDGPTELLVTSGRAADVVRSVLSTLAQTEPDWNAAGALRLHFLPLLSQLDYDHLLWSCDFNFVRGEDSLVRALLAARPFVWQLYPQQDSAHGHKLEAFLERFEPPDALRVLYRQWNGFSSGELPPFQPSRWSAWATDAAAQAHALPELAAALRACASQRL